MTKPKTLPGQNTPISKIVKLMRYVFLNIITVQAVIVTKILIFFVNQVENPIKIERIELWLITAL